MPLSIPLPLLALLLLLLLSTLPSSHAACTDSSSYVLSISLQFTDGRIMERTETAIPLIVAVSHNASFNLFKPTQSVDDPVAQITSQHDPTSIINTFQELKSSGIIRSWYILNDVPVDKVSQLQLNLGGDATRISFIITLSPSPAWFLGVHDYEACRDGKLVLSEEDISLKTYSSGLDRGTSFTSDMQRYEQESEQQPVSNVPEYVDLATLSLEQGVLGVNWWKILLGVLIGVAVIIVLIIFLYPRLRRRTAKEMPMASKDGVDF